MNDRREIKDITKDMHTERKLKCFPHKDMSLIENLCKQELKFYSMIEFLTKSCLSKI